MRNGGTGRRIRICDTPRTRIFSSPMATTICATGGPTTTTADVLSTAATAQRASGTKVAMAMTVHGATRTAAAAPPRRQHAAVVVLRASPATAPTTTRPSPRQRGAGRTRRRRHLRARRRRPRPRRWYRRRAGRRGRGVCGGGGGGEVGVGWAGEISSGREWRGVMCGCLWYAVAEGLCGFH
jgi:hypothetical protein